MKDYNLVKVSKIAKIILGGTPKRSEEAYWGGEIKWASAKDITSVNTRYIYDTEERITELGLKESNTKLLPKDTIVITARGTVGAIAMLSEDMAFNQSCYGLISKDGIDPDYLFYALKASLSKISSVSYGTVFDTITIKSFDSIEIPVPSIEEQKRIAHILGTLDDKIELNQRMNETLEAIARTIFKSWFVDFDPVRAKMAGEPYTLPDAVMALFPDALVESGLGLIPKGWEVTQLKEFGEIITGKTPSTKNPSYYDSKDIPFIKIPDMHDQLFITSTTNKLSKKGADSQSKKYLPTNSICVSCIATPGLVAMTTELSQTNQQINSIIPDDDKMAYYLLLTMANKGEQIRKYGSGGSVVNNLNKTDFSKIIVLVPYDKVVQCFNKRLRNIFKKIINNQQGFSMLRILQDILLSYHFN